MKEASYLKHQKNDLSALVQKLQRENFDLSQNLQLQLKEASYLKHQKNDISALVQNLQRENLDLSQNLQLQLKEASYLKHQTNDLSALVKKLEKENLDLSQKLQLQLKEASHLKHQENNLSTLVQTLQKENFELAKKFQFQLEESSYLKHQHNNHDTEAQKLQKELLRQLELENQKHDLEDQIQHMEEQAERANVDFCDNIMTLVAQRDNLKNKMFLLDPRSRLQEFSHGSELKDQRELLKRNADLQAEFSHEFVALVKKHLELCQRCQDESDRLHLEKHRVLEVIKANVQDFERQYPLTSFMSNNPWAWNEHFRYRGRRYEAAFAADIKNEQLMQELTRKEELQGYHFIRDLQNLSNQLNKLHLSYNFLMRMNSSEVEPKENLDLLFRKLCEAEVVQSVVNEKDEWKKRCMVLTSVIVSVFSLGFVYVPMPMMVVLSIVIVTITVLGFLLK